MRIFITGVTGFIGKNFLERLLPAVPADAVIYCLARKAFPSADNRIKILLGTLENVENFSREMLESDYVFHIGALAVFGNKFDYERVNAEPVKKMAGILSASRVLKNFIYVSTIGAMDRAPDDRCRKPLSPQSPTNPTSRYGRSKLLGEQYLRAGGIPCTVIRATWVYGRNMRNNSHLNVLTSMVCRRDLLAGWHFPGRVSLIHVEDLADALIACLNNSVVVGKTYIGVTECLALGEILEIVGEKVFQRRYALPQIPRFSFLFSRIHAFLPLMINNLFLDYLAAEDRDFVRDLHLPTVKRFSEQVQAMVDSNIEVSGAWVITGANSGIGLAMAKQLERQGKSLVLIDRNIFNLQGFKKAVVIQADLRENQEIKKAVSLFGDLRIAVLINNAGVGFRRSIRELSEEEILTSTKVNALAPIFLTKALLNNLQENSSVIVNVVSTIAYNPLPNMALYSATKAMLLNWSESLTYELRETNAVITVSPSGTFTNFQSSSGVKVAENGRGLLRPDFVARNIIGAAKKRSSQVLLITPVLNKIVILGCRFLPRRFNIWVWGKLFSVMR